MEVGKEDFYKQLLPILKHIACATYVTLDLEMSGIPTRSRKDTRERPDTGKPTLQSHYNDLRDAAGSFQMLQMGITCISEDREKEYYLARPYNFYVSPLTRGSSDIGLDRSFGFSSSACDFLRSNGFDFGKVFSHGVSYLSREEVLDLRVYHKGRADKNKKIENIVIPDSEPSTLEFYNSARNGITAWLNDPNTELSFYNVGSDTGPLNSYQRRLIYQLIRREFPTLRTFSRNDGWFMQVEKLNVQREIEFQKRKLMQLDSTIAKQKGLGWIFEAMSGGDLSGIDPRWLCDYNYERSDQQLDQVAFELADVNKKLRLRRPIVVGHNVLIDLAFIHNTFIGTLPHDVTDFQKAIHANFPIVFDTKYLATCGTDATTPRANLKELLEPLKKLSRPLIVLHENHAAYNSSLGKDHEAGFDSWMTAELFVKLSHKLFLDREHLLQNSGPDVDCESSDDTSSDFSGGALLSAIPPNNDDSDYAQEDNQVELQTEKMSVKFKNNRFSTLADLVEKVASASMEPSNQWVPSIENSFWGIYANKLRVYAIDTGVCDLAEKMKL